jgi:titin
MSTTCAATNTLAAVGAANTTGSDQVYPYLNGNNLYYGLSAVVVAPTAPGQLFWVADVNGAQTVDPNFINPADIAASLLPTQSPAFPLGAMSQAAADSTDAANLVVYTGDDPSNNGITIPPTVSGAPGLGLGRWWQTCQGNPPVVPAPFATNVLGANNCPTPAATQIPGAPTVTRARATASSIVVSWSPAQSHQPVTSYHLRGFHNAILFSDTIVSPAPGSAFPATHKSFAGLGNGSYTFQVSAINAQGESAFSPLSSAVSVPEIDPPGIPTRVSAIAGNASALVSWSPPVDTGGAPISSYTVTVIQQTIRTATTVTVAAPDSSAVISGLTNGTNYSFSVHASNAGGSGMESTPSNTVTPTAAAAAVSVNLVAPPLPDQQFLPGQVTFTVSVVNNTPNAVSGSSITNTLTQLAPDGAFIVLAQPTQGSCSAGGVGVLAVTCPLGTLGPLATVTVNVVVEIKANAATLDVSFTGTDINSSPVSAFGTATMAPPPPPPPATDIQVTGSAANGGPTVTGTLPAGAPDTYTWQVKNAQNVAAPNVKFTDVLPGSLKFDSVTLNPAAIGSCTGPAVGSLGGTVTCSIPTFGGPGNVNQFTVSIAVHVVQTGTIPNTGSAAYKSDTNNANNNFTVTIKAK